MNEKNLRTPTREEARAMQRKGAAKRKENHAKKKLMSQIYAEFLEKKYSIKVGNKTKKISGAELCNEAMKKIIARGDSATVSLLKEVREGTEGTSINLSGGLVTRMETAAEREKLYDEIIGAE